MNSLGRLWQLFLKGREELLGAPFPENTLDVLMIRAAYILSNENCIEEEGRSQLPNASSEKPLNATLSEPLAFKDFNAVLARAREKKNGTFSCFAYEAY